MTETGLKTLFIGNSYTYGHRLPEMLATMAASARPPHPMTVEMVASGGVTFAWHWQNAETRDALATGTWDVVVLQNHSLGAIEGKDDMHTFGAKLIDAVKAIGARPVLYMTWAREHKPEMQQAITREYVALASSAGADVAPVGLAWQKILTADQALQLHVEDQSHPTGIGTYLTACVIYATLFGTTPVGLTGTIVIDDEQILDLPEAEARFLQEAAWQVVANPSQ